MKSKVLIIGSGPAGYSAAIYAARAALDPVLVTGHQPGGQLTITTDVENYPGFADVIQGPWLMDQMKDQAMNVGTKIVDEVITSVDFSGGSSEGFRSSSAKTDYISETVIIATGARAKWLGLPSEEYFQGFGVSGCATCDGFFFKGKKVMVVGGGNTAVEEAIFLTKHASEVLVLHRRDELRADKILQKKMFENDKITPIWNSVLEEILGKDDPKSVTGVRIKNVKTEELSEISLDGVFIAIGHAPNTDIFKEYLDMDEHGYITTVPGSTITNVPGVFASGDVQDKIYRQAVTAAGTGCMAALDVNKFLMER